MERLGLGETGPDGAMAPLLGGTPDAVPDCYVGAVRRSARTVDHQPTLYDQVGGHLSASGPTGTSKPRCPCRLTAAPRSRPLDTLE